MNMNTTIVYTYIHVISYGLQDFSKVIKFVLL